jgi:hypothetical protein
MDIITSVVIVAIVIVVAFIFFSSKQTVETSSNVIDTVTDGKKLQQSKKVLNPSLNQEKGITFSYVCWLRIDDYTYNYGKEKVVFVKGATDLSSVCPGVFIDGNTNTLLVKVDTFGAQEIVPIPNLPAKKWFHFGLVVDQDSMDVYINGVVHTHHTIAQLPRQNTGSVHVGLNGGFDGKIANLTYNNFFMTPEQIASSMGTPPKEPPEDTSMPPYFDITWWTGR